MTDHENTLLHLSENYWVSRILDVSQLPQHLHSLPSSTSLEEIIDLSLAEQKADKIARGNLLGKFSIYTALFAVVLQRFFYVDELLINTPVITDSLPEEDRLLFLHLTAQDSLKRAIQQVSQDLQKSAGYEKYRYAQVRERLAGHTEALQRMHAFGVSCENLSKPSLLSSQTWLTLHVQPGEGACAVLRTYGTNCDEYTLKAIGTAFLELAENIDRLADMPVTAIGLAPVAETVQQKALPENGLLHELFEKQAEQTPDAVAVVYNGNDYPYKSINESAVALAAYLSNNMKVQRGDRVAFVMERTDKLIITLLAILKAGATYVPVDIAYPAAFKDRLLSDVQPACLLLDTAAELTPGMSGLRQLFVTDALLNSISATRYVPPVVKPADLAYIIYTSGSTGAPKGVMITHQSAVNYLKGFAATHPQCVHYDYALVSSVAFDASLRQVFFPFMSGHAVHLLASTRDAAAVIHYFRQNHIKVLSCSPSFYRNLLAQDTFPACAGDMELFILGGEQLSRELVGNIRQLSPAAVIINAYGPTEVTVNALTAVVQEGPKDIPVGIPLPGYTVYIHDRYGHTLPAGATGEICVSGIGVAKGYLNRDAATAEKFITHTTTGTTIYKTGDWGRLLPDGHIYFLGRMDQQVKVRGYRVECEAVATALVQAGARQAIVTPFSDAGGETALAAYLTGVTNEHLTTVKEQLRIQLPPFMLPATYILMEHFPVNVNGKTDLKQLPHPLEKKEEQQSFQPENDIQRKLGDIWKEVLDRDDFTADDIFFELGGHSLSATQVLTRIHRHISTEITLVDMFRHKTIRALETVLNNIAPAVHTAIPVIATAVHYPLSHAQKRLWLLDSIGERLVQYNMINVCKLSGEVDVPRLTQAWALLIARYEILRTVFRMEDGEPRQFIKEYTLAGVLAYEAVVTTIAVADERIQSESNFHFNLATGPLVRAQLLRTGIHEYIFILNIHHIISDQWSQRLLMRELFQYYNQLQEHAGFLPAPLRIQYKDYSYWQLHNLEQSAADEQRQFWQQQLQGTLPVLDMPLDYPRPAVKTNTGAGITMQFPADILSGLQQISRQEDASLFIVMMSLFNVLLHKYTRQQDIITGTPVSGREHIDLEEQLGFFVNMIPVRTTINGEENFTVLLQRVKEQMLEAYRHLSYPFDKVVEDQQLVKDSSRSALFDVVFQLTKEQKEELPAGVNLSAYHTATTASVFDLILHFTEQEAGGVLHLSYNTSLFREISMLRFVEQFVYLAQQVAEVPTQLLHQLQLMKAEEYALVTQTFNSTTIPYPVDATLVELFRDQANVRPENTALVYQQNTWTYHQLNVETDRMAAFLVQDAGVQAGDTVAMIAPRSDAAVCWMLAILKAGAAYLPVDADYPSARIDAMLTDAGVKLAITDEARDYPAGIQIIGLHIRGQAAIAFTGVTAATDTAYVMYTSGSTGKPKGVKVSHRNIIRLVKGNNPITTGITDRLLLTGSLAFDATTFEIWSLLLNGGQLHIIPQEQLMNTAALKAAIAGAGITVMWFTVSWFNQLVDADISLFATLRTLIVGGDRLSLPPIAKLKAAYPHLQIINGYGPTEGTTFTTCHLITEEDLTAAIIPIGKPVSNTMVYILDEQQQPLPVGIPGEIFIGGDGVAAGYLHDAALTDAKFIPNPFTSGGYMYCSGDIGRWREDGTILFTGRKDAQIKIRGYRVECGEVEAAILAAGIKECVVIPVPEAHNNSSYLTAYILQTDGIAIAALKLRLQEQLPAYMIPAVFMELPVFPLTPQGKIDKRKLPVPEEWQQATYAAPRNAVEEILAGIWEELLQKGQVGINDNFFDLGGHSLLAMRLMAAIRKSLGKEISIRTIFTHPTIAALSSVLDAASSSISFQPLEKYNRNEHTALSFGQERLWFIHKMQGSTQYHIACCYRLKGKPDVTLLERSFRTVVNRHEVLRTLIAERDGVLYQQVMEEDRWQLDIVTGARKNDIIQAQVAALIATPFRLFADHMLRAHLISAGNDEYLLLVTVHHIAADGWSNSILARELSAVYNALLKQQEAVLPLLPVQYSDYAIWQRNNLEAGILQGQLNYWKQQLSGIATLQLPLDFLRPALQSSEGGICYFSLDHELTTLLRQLARSEGSTLFMTLMTAFHVLLSKYTGQEDICVGTPVAGRTHQETEALIGVFINLLALRSNLEGNPSFRGLLQQVKQTTLEAYAHQDIPFEKVVDVVGVERDLSRSPVFQVMFVLHNTPQLSFPQLEGIHVEEAPLMQVTSQYDLTVSLEETADGLACNIVYATALFREGTILGLIDHFKQLLQDIARNADAAIGELSMLGKAEVQQLNEFSCAMSPAYPQDTFLSFFAAQVAQTPDATAVIFEEEQWSYAQLNSYADLLAADLLSKGIPPQTLVPVCMDRSIHMLAAILGIMKAGAAFVPVDPSYPQARISYILADTGAGIVVGDAACKERLKDFSQIAVMVADNVTASPVIQLTAPKPDHMAYVIYTSGSTGTPKGVIIAHHALHHFLQAMKTALALEAPVSLLAVTTYCFDIAYLELLLPLSTGGKVIIAGSEKTANAYTLSQLLALHQPSHMQATPATWQMLLDSGWQNKEKVVVLTGGEAIREELKDRLFQAGGTSVHNLYGPTEATIWATHQVLRPDEKVNIGRPLGNTNIYILDRHRKQVPVGIAGEICIGGPQIARGYLNLPELTTDRFIPHPYRENERLYCTGDTGRWLPDGSIECLGRTDDQLKIRGYRIEPGEIENVLSTCLLVKQAVVLTKTDSTGNNRLVAYVVSEGEFDREEIIGFLKERLPDYMIPYMLLDLPQLPLTANGKINRKALQAMDMKVIHSDDYVAPRNDTEKMLAGIWQDLLEREQVGIRDDFFALGGHSLLAVRFIAAIRKTFHKEISLRDLFAHPTIELSAGLISATETGVLLPAIAKGNRRAVLPLSYSQERLWFIDQLTGTVPYHIPYCCRLTGDLDEESLEESFRTIVRRHEVLRTVITATDGAARQEIIPAGSWHLDYKLAEDIGDIDAFISQVFTQPFALDKDSMLKAGIIRISESEHLFYVVLHHIAGDAWSIDILLKELSLLYRHLRKGTAPLLDALPVQYADYACWQRQHITGALLDSRLEYWQQKLRDVSPLGLYTDYIRPAVPGIRSGVVSSVLDIALQQELFALSQKEGTTMFMTVLAAFKVLLYHYTGQEDICVGSPVAGRRQAEVEGLIGFFVNTLALRNNVAGDDTFAHLLQQVKQTTLEAHEYQDAPFEKVVEVLGLERDMGRNAVFQVMFLLQQHAAQQAPELAGLKVETIDQANGYSEKFDLTMGTAITDDGLQVNISYAADLFEEATIAEMLRHFENVLKAVTTDPQVIIGKIPLLTTEEAGQLPAFNDTRAIYPAEESITALFSAQVLQTPENSALLSAGATLSYRMLESQANKLAHYLAGKGVTAEMPVAVCMDKGPGLIISTLAILKAGGAFVPVDKDYPLQRISYIINDTGAVMILTDTDAGRSLPALQDLTVINLDEVTAEINSYPDTPIIYESSPDHLAYIMYTSGSTGVPKGVMVTHQNVVSLVKNAGYVQFHASQVLLSTGAVSFDATTFEYWGMLLNGGTLVLCSQQQLLDPYFLRQQIKANGVNTMWFTTGWFNQLVDTSTQLFEGLDTILLGGEKASEKHIRLLKTAYPDMRVINCYGPTENTTFSLTYDVRPEDYSRSIPIGKPLNNREVYIVNSYGNLSPVGVPGEIYLGGAGLSKGYLHQPALTAEKFVPHLFHHEEGARLYRTGDLGKWLPDGSIAFLGRTDDQLKLRGYRIEPGEIAYMVLQSKLAEQAVVTVITDPVTGNRQLAGYAAAKNGLDKKALITWLQQQLPDYMVPQIWVELPEMPLNANGKVDKGRLPIPEIAIHSSTHALPRNPVEESLSFIWKELLGIPGIGIHDHFFRLGGHSLLAVRVTSAIRKILGKEISVRELFASPTIAGLAALLSSRDTGSALPAITCTTGSGNLPLSYSQERLRFIDKLQGSLAYHISCCWRLHGQLDIAALEQSFISIVNRHEVLRSVMVQEDGNDYQLIQAAGEWRMQVTGAVTDIDTFVADFINTPFRLETDPVLRVTVATTSPQSHVLVIVLHHIAGDGWSVGLLLDELSASYAALRREQAPTLPALPVQYADYAVWQRRYVSGAALNKGLAYWQQQLEGVPALGLYTDYPRPLIAGSTGGVVNGMINAHLSRQLKKCAYEAGASLFMTILAAFKILLYRYTGQEDICVGSPVAGRGHAETEDLIGCFVNTLALRTRINGNASFATVLEQVKHTCLDAFEHQDVPFEKVVESLGVDRDTSRHALFQIMFILQNNTGTKELELEGITADVWDNVNAHTEKFDLTVAVGETADGLQITISYNAALYHQDSITRLLGHYMLLLEEVAVAEDTTVDELNMLTTQERTLLQTTFNNNTVTYSAESVVAMFIKQASLHPAHIALLHGNTTMSYQELDARSNQLAHYLLANGAGAEQLIGICMERHPDMFVSILGILKAGAAYVPLDPAYPPERLRYMLEDSKATMVLTDSRSKAQLSFSGDFNVVVMDQQDWHTYATTPVSIVLTPSQLAYVIYTSGSTGKPKGVMITHGSISNFIHWSQDEFADSRYDIMYAATSICFDLSVFECWYPLSTGNTIRILDNGLSIPQYLTTDTGVFINTVPGVVNALLHEVTDWSRVSLLNMAGEAVPLHIQHAPALAGLEVRNLYGPSETTTYSTCYRLQPHQPLLIGKPVANTQIYIVDNAGQLLPQGVPGEICIAGAGLARGYLHQPVLTAEKFVADPFSQQPGARMYRTGDLGRWLPDGHLDFLGRKDEQVKVRGYRIEPGEIEKVAVASGLLEQAVVAVQESDGENQLLVGYAISQRTVDTVALINYLRQHLPEYMVPLSWMILEAFPLNSNGKINRKQLPAHTNQQTAPATATPRNKTEATLVKIWCELLEIEEVGIFDNFFAKGGHSLLGGRVVAAVRKSFGKELAIKDLFSHPTIAGLSELIGATDEGMELAPLIKHEDYPVIPLSYAQERLWFIDKLQGSVQYHIPFSCRFIGALDIAALEKSFRVIIDRHPALRTVILQEEGEPAQYITDGEEWSLLYQEASRLEDVNSYVSGVLNSPFSMERDSMVRVGLIRQSAEDHIFFMVLHHIAGDGWSIGILLDELSLLYRHISNGTFPQLQELPVQYSDYAIWQRQQISGELLAAHLEYWRGKLTGVAPLSLFTDFTRPAIQSSRGGVAGKTLSPALYAQLLSLSQREGATLFMTILSAFKILLYHYTGQQDICVGSPVAGRRQAEVEGLVGLFVNTLALRSDISGKASFREILQQVKKTTLEAYEHQDVPYEKVVEALGVERDMSRNPVFQVMFVLENTSGRKKLHLEGITVEEMRAGEILTEKFDITVGMAETPEGLYLNISYCKDLYQHDTILQLMRHYENILHEIIADPDTLVDELNMLTTQERTLLQTTFNNNTVTYSAESVVAMFIKQASLHPAHIALLHGNTTMSYQELDARSNQLAHYLLANGAGAEQLIGICMERHPDMFVSILGILKAGAAYVPLDPAYPRERLRYMLEDSKATMVLTDSRSKVQLSFSGDFNVVVMDQQDWHTYATTPVSIVLTPSQLAYVIYTSGSTGKPKGVMITHGSVSNFIHWSQDEFADSRYDIMYAATSICFDLSVFECWYPLSTGNTIRILDNGLSIPQYLTTDTGVFINTVPGVVNALLHEVTDWSRVSLLNMAGEAVPLHIQHAPALAGLEVRNLYGPSETTTYSTCYRLQPHQPLLIGKPVANTQIYIVNNAGQLLPQGVPGEICIAGAGLARGYLHQPVLTAEKFVADPFSQQPGARMYRTGDLGRWLPDGQLDYLGRKDEQVKMNGYRIELGEIEQVVLESKLVTQVVVLLKSAVAGGDKQLVGYLAAPAEFNREPLITYMRSRLPEYMIPASWILLEAWPLNANGKIDKLRLPVPEMASHRAGYEPPATAGEQQLASLWEELLGISKAGRYDHFFERGGHSLNAVRLSGMMSKKWKRTIELKDIFFHPILSDMAAFLGNPSLHSSYINIPVSPLSAHYPLTAGQMRIWLLDELHAGTPAYNVPVLLKMTGNLDIPRLKKSLQLLVNRHESLRTVFRLVDGVPRQFIIEEETAWPVLKVIDTRHESNPWESALQMAASLASCTFHLNAGPLMHTHLMQTGKTTFLLLINFHHIITDSWSIDIIAQELTSFYQALRNDPLFIPAPLSLQYKDYVHWCNTPSYNASRQQDQLFWRSRFRDGVPKLNLRTDNIRQETTGFRGHAMFISFSDAECSGLRELARKEQLSLFPVLMTMIKIVLYRYAAQTDIVLGMPVSGRMHPDLEQQIGYFLNTLAVRSRLQPDKSFIENLRIVSSNVTAAMAHQQYPYDELVNDLSGTHTTDNKELFSVLVSLDRRLPGVAFTGFDEVEVTALPLSNATAKFELSFLFTDTDNGIICHIEYSEVFDVETIEYLATGLKQLLLFINSSKPIHQFELLQQMETDDQDELNFNFN